MFKFSSIGNAMNAALPILLITPFINCMTPKQKPHILMIPFLSDQASHTIAIDTIQNPIVFSEAFWQHFTTTFPKFTSLLFTPSEDHNVNFIQLTDTSYFFNLISSSTQILLRNHLPKNLSKEESTAYFYGTGFFVLTDSSNAADSIRGGEKQWVQASSSVEKEYEQFFVLVTNLDHEYVIIAKKNLVNSFLNKDH